MSNYLRSIPPETYQKVLLKLDPKNLKILCLTDKYVQEICKDNYFNYQYINFNFDPYKYGYASWDYNKNINWKSILDKISSNKKIVPISAGKGTNLYVPVHKNDTVADIINRAIRIFTLFNKGRIAVIRINGSKLNIQYVIPYLADLKHEVVIPVSGTFLENISLQSVIGDSSGPNGETIFNNISEIIIAHHPQGTLKPRTFIPNDNII